MLTATKKMMVVDPSAPIFASFRNLLESQGVMIDVCETYEDAVLLLKANSYDVALMDVWQAGVWLTNGLDLLGLLRERRPDVKIILLTGIESNDVRKRAKELGAALCLEKPVLSSTIFEALRKLGIIE
jgi:ActR/RegA family two-component response regulator